MTVIRRPSRTSTTIQFTIPNDLRAWAEEYAEDNGLSVAAVMREAISLLRYETDGPS